MEEIIKLMQCFPESVIKPSSEVILNAKGNVSFIVWGGMTRKEIMCKIFEWCSRDCAKAAPYSSEKRNSEWRDSLILKFNRYLGTNFSQNDFYWIYDRLGNGINHTKTLRFIEDGCDVEKLLKYED